VERSQGSGTTTFTQVGTSTGTNYNDTGLMAGTVYNYRVRATDAAGNLSGNSAVATATTLSLADTTAPTAPRELTAKAASSNQIILSWTASTDNVGVTGYWVERRHGNNGSFTQIGTSSSTTYTSSGLSSRTSYSYRVRATDAAGNLSGYSNVANATTTR
jgi:chitodextrinase